MSLNRPWLLCLCGNRYDAPRGDERACQQCLNDEAEARAMDEESDPTTPAGKAREAAEMRMIREQVRDQHISDLEKKLETIHETAKQALAALDSDGGEDAIRDAYALLEEIKQESDADYCGGDGE